MTQVISRDARLLFFLSSSLYLALALDLPIYRGNGHASSKLDLEVLDLIGLEIFFKILRYDMIITLIMNLAKQGNE